MLMLRAWVVAVGSEGWWTEEGIEISPTLNRRACQILTQRLRLQFNYYKLIINDISAHLQRLDPLMHL